MGAQMSSDNGTVYVDAPAAMKPSLAATAVRMSYLYPTFAIAEHDGGLSVSGVPKGDREIIKREVSYLLYREHIRGKFAPYRRKALDRVYGGAK